MSRFTTRQLAAAGLLAAVYAAATLLLPIPQYLGVQFRMAEALTLLPFFLPEAIVGLTAGCFLANFLGSPILLDWLFGIGRFCRRCSASPSSWERRLPGSPFRREAAPFCRPSALMP